MNQKEKDIVNFITRNPGISSVNLLEEMDKLGYFRQLSSSSAASSLRSCLSKLKEGGWVSSKKCKQGTNQWFAGREAVNTSPTAEYVVEQKPENLEPAPVFQDQDLVKDTLTLRDFFAATALRVRMFTPITHKEIDHVVNTSYMIADAMLKEREVSRRG